MEFVNLGAHCSEKTCREEDFLPFICEACELSFCRDHRTYEGHRCEAKPLGNLVFPCPLCKKGVEVVPGEDESITWERHAASEECKINQVEKCAAPRCSTRLSEINSIKCKKCHEAVCLKHRFSDSHKCEHPLERRQVNYRCGECAEGFRISTDLLKHFQTVHVS